MPEDKAKRKGKKKEDNTLVIRKMPGIKLM